MNFMKMKAIVLAAFLSLAGIAAHAQQEAHFGIKGGFSSTAITDADEWRGTGFGGVFVNIPLGWHWYLQPEVLYAGQGGIYGNGRYYFDPTDPNNTTLSMGYVQVPLMFQFHVNRVFYLEFGPQVEFLTSAKAITDGVKTDVSSNFNKVDADLNFGFGLNCGPVVSLFARYNLGLSDVYNDNGPSEYNRGAQIGIGFKFPNGDGYERRSRRY
ncbi:porin family protein [Dinghuibacter silviterrae]|uniref:Outer membrane protein with beta-barrel domain n=1 Tax=Dinghuibacter silviterrae TaxID=1539049 RepID=A0A4R8DUE4_9BACT|nr:porin family protein [Dinghuibacter silviterrae]TDX01075.1 outer membrane protein with beta-barrel domain [Dinghuibacter silviterrae]